MKEFVEKLIEQLEERIQDNNGWEDDDFFGGQSNAFEWTISVIKKLEEEYGNDCCEWIKEPSRLFGYVRNETSCGDNIDLQANTELLKAFIFCPFCGKKIKVVE